MIYILFTTDAQKSHSSRVLRGACTNKNKLSEVKRQLVKNSVVESEEEIEVIELTNGEFETAGGYF
jgi:predicted transcriptional regulator